MIRCGLVTIAPFPKGNVTTIRYSSYLRALHREGVYTKVYIYAPTRMAKHISTRTGNYEGIDYEYTTKPFLEKYSLIRQLNQTAIGIIQLLKSLKKDGINVLILNEEQPWILTFILYLYCLLNRILFIGEKTEYPPLSVRHNKFREWLYSFKIRMYDSMILITKELQKYFSVFLNHKTKTFLLPVTIDMNRYATVNSIDYSTPYIATVFGVHNRDGLEESLLSYSNYLENGGSFDLWLIGDYNSMPNKSKLDSIIKSNCLEKRVRICGKVDILSVPSFLKSAKCLLTTPNFYISGGFPTKLGEYMLSGVPIVATDAGEIKDYVEDGKDIFLSKPGDIKDITNKLLYIEHNEGAALNVANAAEIKARHIFNAQTYAKPLIDFLGGFKK